MTYQKFAAASLAEWRSIERHLATVDPLSAEADELRLESHRLRVDYELVIAAAAESHRIKPFPEHAAAPARLPRILRTLKPGLEFCDGCREWIDPDEPIVATRATVPAGAEHAHGPVWIYHADCLPPEDMTWRTAYRGLLTASG